MNFKGEKLCHRLHRFHKGSITPRTRMGASGYPFHPGLAGKRVRRILNRSRPWKRVFPRDQGEKGAARSAGPCAGLQTAVFVQFVKSVADFFVLFWFPVFPWTDREVLGAFETWRLMRLLKNLPLPESQFVLRRLPAGFSGWVNFKRPKILHLRAGDRFAAQIPIHYSRIVAETNFVEVCLETAVDSGES